jgi:hypothetical protein
MDKGYAFLDLNSGSQEATLNVHHSTLTLFWQVNYNIFAFSTQRNGLFLYQLNYFPSSIFISYIVEVYQEEVVSQSPLISLAS